MLAVLLLLGCGCAFGFAAGDRCLGVALGDASIQAGQPDAPSCTIRGGHVSPEGSAALGGPVQALVRLFVGLF